MPKSNTKGFIVYEESMPLVQLVDFLTINHFAAVISPVHDKDTYTAEDVKKWRESQETLHGVYVAEDATTWERPTGELRINELGAQVRVTETRPVPQVGDLKKPHRHVFVQLDYSAQLSAWLNLFAPLDIHYLEEIRSKRGYLRYLAHLDNPEKARYNVHEIISLGGVDISCVYEQTQRDADNMEIRILNHITENRIHNVGRLQRYLLEEAHDMEAYREVKAHYGYWRAYMLDIYTVAKVEVSGKAPKLLDWDADGVVLGAAREIAHRRKENDDAGQSAA